MRSLSPIVPLILILLFFASGCGEEDKLRADLAKTRAAYKAARNKLSKANDQVKRLTLKVKQLEQRNKEHESGIKALGVRLDLMKEARDRYMAENVELQRRQKVLVAAMRAKGGDPTMLLAALARAKESARRSSCLMNLKQIGLALHMYSQDFDRVFPDDLRKLYTLYITDATIFKCPSGKHGYKYIIGISSADPAATVLAFDAPNNHGDKAGRNVLYLDGFVSWSSEQKFQQNLRRTLDSMRKRGKTVKVIDGPNNRSLPTRNFSPVLPD